MRISMLQDNLKNGLDAVSKSVSKKSTLPILETVRLRTERGRLSLSTTNLDWSVTVGVSASIEQDGSACVPFAMLSKLVSALSPERIDLEAFQDETKHSLSVNCGATNTKITGFDPTDYPVISERPDGLINYIAVPVGKFIEAVKSVEFCADTDGSRPILEGVYFELVGNKLGLTACDGYQLGHKELEVTTVDGTLDFNAVVPVGALNDVCWILAKQYDKDDEIFISLDGTQMLIGAAWLDIRVNCIEGHFPDWRQIVPRTFDVTAIVDPVALRSGIKRASAIMEKHQRVISLEVKPSLFYIGVQKSTVQQKTVLDAVTTGETLSGIMYNQLDTITAHLIPNKTLWVQVKLSLNSIRGTGSQAIRIEAVRDSSLFYVLMSAENSRD